MAWLDPFTDASTTPLSTVRLTDARQVAEHAVENLRSSSATDHGALAQALYRAGQFALALGDGQAAVNALAESFQIEPTGAAHIGLGWALRLLGDYAQAQIEFERVLAESSTNTTLVGLAFVGLARCACDCGNWEAALAKLDKALPILQDEQLTYHEAAARLVQAELHTRLGQDADAQITLDRVDAQLISAKIHWLRPEWWALKARLAFAKGDSGAAEKAARRGLGATDDRGDMQSLPTLYRTLAAALERGRIHTGIDDARDARHRSVLAAQTCAARLELARALHEIGLHYKLYANRPTLRARGSGYLYEADKHFQAMGISAPSTSGTTVPLL
ncbi:MAG: tetratricopeptide repeat protein [Aggregatilineales bacterium]